MAERLQKLMAQAGIASRREAEEIITQGRVMVNGQQAKLGDKADPVVDDVRIDGAKLRTDETRVYVMVNKPMGVITAVTAQEQERRRTVRDMVPLEGHLYPVGRLDADSEGLVLLTNDGELAQKLTHPRYEHPKVYEVALVGHVPDSALDIWRRGVVLDDGPTKPVDLKVLTRDKDMTWVRITMREGRKRQIRRIGNTLAHPVKRLVRTQLDTLSLGSLKVGEWRYLTDSEIKQLQQSAASTPHHGKAHSEGTGLVTTPPRVARTARPAKTARSTSGTPRRAPARAGRKPIMRSRTQARPISDDEEKPARSARPVRTGDRPAARTRSRTQSSTQSGEKRSRTDRQSTEKPRRRPARTGKPIGSLRRVRPGRSKSPAGRRSASRSSVRRDKSSR